MPRITRIKAKTNNNAAHFSEPFWTTSRVYAYIMRRSLLLIVVSLLIVSVAVLSNSLPGFGSITLEQVVLAVFFAPIIPFVADPNNLTTSAVLSAAGFWIAAFVAIDAFLSRRKKPAKTRRSLRTQLIALTIFFVVCSVILVSATNTGKIAMLVVCGFFYLLSVILLFSLDKKPAEL